MTQSGNALAQQRRETRAGRAEINAYGELAQHLLQPLRQLIIDAVEQECIRALMLGTRHTLRQQRTVKQFRDGTRCR